MTDQPPGPAVADTPSSGDGTPFGPYRLLELLGRGGMGEVWRAYDSATDRVVALKVLPAHLAEDPVFKQRFRREAHAAARLSEPHIVPIHTYGEIDGRLFVDMRLIRGRDLQTVLADGPLPHGRALLIIEQVAQALHAAHEIGLVHRDVKPSNILITDTDFAYLIDFGIARAVDDTALTKTGGFIGSPHYMAPERFNTGQADARSDIYALACVLYEALTGSRPFPGDSWEQQLTGHLATPPPRPSSSSPGVPAGFDAVIAKGMAKNPDHRYATTEEFAHAARDATTEPIPRPAAPPTEPAAASAAPPGVPPIMPPQQTRTAQAPRQRQKPESVWAPAYQPFQHTPPPAGAIPYPPTPPPAVRVPSPRPRWTSKVVWPLRIVVGLIALGYGPVLTVTVIFSPGSRGNPLHIWGVIVVLVSWAVVLYLFASVTLEIQRRWAPGKNRDAQRRTVLIVTALGAIVAVIAVLIMIKHTSSSRLRSSPVPPAAVELPFPGLREASDVAVDTEGNLYVTDNGPNRVLKLAAGSTTPTPLPFTGLKNPTGVAVDTAGAVYVTDGYPEQRVLKLAPGATEPTVLLHTPDLNPVGVAVDAAGTVYVAEAPGEKVLKLPAGATTPTTVSLTGPSGMSFGNLRSIAVDTGGNVYLTTLSEVWKLPPGATTPAQLPFSDLEHPKVAVDGPGTVYVSHVPGVDADPNGGVLKLPSGATTPIPLLVAESGDGVYPSGVAVDNAGNVYIANGLRVLKLPAQ